MSMYPSEESPLTHKGLFSFEIFHADTELLCRELHLDASEFNAMGKDYFSSLWTMFGSKGGLQLLDIRV
jgi:hypothetical protein